MVDCAGKEPMEPGKEPMEPEEVHGLSGDGVAGLINGDFTGTYSCAS